MAALRWKLIHTLHGIILCEGPCCLLSSIYHITGRRKGKGLEVPYKYNYYAGPTKEPVLIQDPALILLQCYFPRPLNDTRHLYETGYNLRQYGTYPVHLII